MTKDILEAVLDALLESHTPREVAAIIYGANWNGRQLWLVLGAIDWLSARGLIRSWHDKERGRSVYAL